MDSLSVWIGFAIGAVAGALAIGLAWLSWEKHHAVCARRRREVEGEPIDQRSAASEVPYSNSAGA